MTIYPKSFALGKRNIESSTCFILMPFHKDLNSVYGIIKELIENLGIKCNRADDIFESIPILSTTIEQILRSEFIIADLTNRNPNVFYEVGLSHSFRDPENVILIAQAMDDIPFDIRHLPIIIYDPGNKFQLAESIKNRITTARSKIGKKRFLLDYFSSIDLPYALTEVVIDKIRERNPQFIEHIYMLLADKDEFSAKNIKSLELDNLVREIDSFSFFADGDSRKLLYRIKLNVLISISDIPEVQNYCLMYLQDNSRDVTDSRVRDDLSFSADLACHLVKKELHKSAAINWLLKYLKNSRVSGIDIVRNRIDEFLVSINDNDIDTALIKLMSSENCTLKESAIDILTQKKNVVSYSCILTNLPGEVNIYVVRSMINGLSRFENPSSGEIVFNWIRNNNASIKQQKAYFLFDVSINFFQKMNLYHLAEEVVRLKSTFS